MFKSSQINPVFSFDIFCKVIDNYGDIGVCFRLAQNLVNLNQQVRLFVDDLTTFSNICPQIKPNYHIQQVNKITVIYWHDNLVNFLPLSNVIIEAFACDLPEQITTHIGKQNLWLNLEYLSCESWVENWHGLPSMQQNKRKYVYFPSLVPNAGGVLHEAYLPINLNDLARAKFLAKFNIYPAQNAQIISVFCYENAELFTWFDYLSLQKKQTVILLAQSPIVSKINHYFNCNLSIANNYQIGNLTLHLLPFVSQKDFDYVLASCDFNIVRGEDSFLRAQFVAKPFIWHIYQQAENIHLIKLQAFLDLYLQNYANSAQIYQLFLNFNQGKSLVDIWQKIDFFDLQIHAKNWANWQLNKPDLASLLVQFVAQRL